MVSFPVEPRFFGALGCRSCQREIDIPEIFGNEVLDLSVSLNDEAKSWKLTWALGKVVKWEGNDIEFN